MTDFKDRVILVTGAGQGLGRAAALALAAAGATVILSGRKMPKLDEVYDAIEAAGGAQPAIFPLNLAEATDREFEALADAVVEQLGRLDGILHCAALFDDLSPLEGQTVEQWSKLLRVNLIAPFALTRACAPLLRAAPDAAVVFVSESHALQPAAFWGGFAVSKSGLGPLATIFSEEWSRHPNVRVNVLVPGPVNTPQRLKSHPGEDKAAIPQPEDLVPAFLYLLGPQSTGISGKVFAAESLLPPQ